MLKKHLKGGVKKGAFTEEQMEEKFNTWVSDKEGKIAAKAGNLQKDADALAAKALDAEKAINEARIAANAPVVETPEAPAEDAADASNEEE